MDKEQMLSLRLEGYPYSYIAKQAGVSRQRIQQLLSPPSVIRKLVVEKYSGCCADCGIFVGKSGHLHHNNFTGEENYKDTANLLLLCISCHRSRHAGTNGLNAGLWRKLNERRLADRLTWKRLANEMGVSVDILRLWGQEKRPLGGIVLRAIVRVYPELAGYVLNELLEV